MTKLIIDAKFDNEFYIKICKKKNIARGKNLMLNG
jgi:hypothetical protein